MSSTVKNILIAIVAVGIIGGGIGFYLFNKKVASTEEMSVNFTTKMEDLYGEFEKDEKAAFEKYKDKVIEVSGTVQSKSEADKEHVDLTLGSEAMAGTVAVSLETSQIEKATSIKEGSKVVLRGICTGIQSAEKSADGEESLLDDLGKEVQLKKGIIVTAQ